MKNIGISRNLKNIYIYISLYILLYSNNNYNIYRSD